jgi:hypothetical protein
VALPCYFCSVLYSFCSSISQHRLFLHRVETNQPAFRIVLCMVHKKKYENRRESVFQLAWALMASTTGGGQCPRLLHSILAKSIRGPILSFNCTICGGNNRSHKHSTPLETTFVRRSNNWSVIVFVIKKIISFWRAWKSKSNNC